MNIIWHRQNNSLPEKAYSTSARSAKRVTNTLTIPNVTNEDTGNYYCVVWAKVTATRSKVVTLFLAGTYSYNITTYVCLCTSLQCTYIYIIFILDTPLLPSVKVLSVVNLTINDFILTMECLPDKNDLQYLYSYTWVKKNDGIPLRARGINSPTLTIFNVIPKDSGDYQCTLSNSTGKISSDFSTVNVTGIETNLHS